MLKDYVVAGSLEEAEEYLDSGNGSFQIVAGGTDVMVDLKKGKSSSEKLLDINNICELKEIREEDGNIIIGGAVTFQEIIESKLINEKLPVLVQACSKVGSWQIRNRGTLAGNIVHAQPAADGAVVMFALGATSTFTIPPNEPVLDQYIINDKVRYYWDEVAAVAADSEEAAKRAIDLISVEYEELPTVYDSLEAMEADAPDIHEDCETGKNIPGHIINLNLGDVEKGFGEADHVFEHTFKLPKVKQTQLETQAALAKIDKSGDVIVWSPTQTPHPSRAILANVFKIPYSKRRVLNPPYIGGAFGVRIGLSAKAEPIALALAMAAKRPVKVIYSREEDFMASDSRHDDYVKVKTGVNSDGTFVAREVRGTVNAGAYCSWSAELPGVVGAMALSIYRCPNQKYVGHSVYTNTAPSGAMREFSSPQGTTAVETQVDYIAEELGIDPMEIRKKNIMRPGDESVLPYECQSSGLEECLDRGASSIGWKKRNQFSNEGPVKRGIGFAVGVPTFQMPGLSVWIIPTLILPFRKMVHIFIF